MSLNNNPDARTNASFNQEKEPTLEELLAQSKPSAFELTDEDREWLNTSQKGHEYE